MKKIFLDTNIIIDLLSRPEREAITREFMIKAMQSNKLCISFLTVANTAYILRKLPREELINHIKTIQRPCTILPNTEKEISMSLEETCPDFEDMLQYQTALSGKCDLIVTRNIKHFSFSALPLMTVEDYMAD